ncbi:valine--tRNA ligase, partial [archaeon]|nr:valine--tRNA ligase [archaeon]
MKIDKNYDFTSEDEIYRGWEDSGFFNPDKLPNSKKRKPFTISMPPPNATGVLHIGHAARMATQDIIIRFQRMRGRRTLWLPGTDHAAIATNSKVAGILHDKGIEVKDIPRQEFLDEIEKYVAKSRGTIQKQIRAMGASCDWSRERFTLDKDMNHAVIEAFERMYKDGIVYRGQRVVHWDPKLKTNISDDEVDHVEEKTKFYYFKYGPFTIGTARPETKFGDKYLVVHPKDKRYSKYKHGQTFELEWINGFITATVIKDEAAIIEVGSGAMTITPWHSSVDFEIAERHKLDREQIINFDGNLLPIAGEFSGMPIEKAREKIVAKLKKKGLLVKVDEDYVHNLATNSRGGGTIEPQIREQWFINVNKKTKALGGQTIKQRSLGVVKSGEIEVIPKRFEKIYYNWLEGLYDWNISRQIVYGHRIPAWYKDGQIKVGHVAPKGTGWKQDPDTLDTWFSTGLWTFSTLGWPKKTDDLKNYHPTDLLETGYDIIFFWVARMIIMTTYHTQQVPFKQVYLSGLVRDDQGRKMSKSLGNITDPLGIIKKYGVDPLRLALIIGVTPGNDVNMGDEKIGGYRNFVNKLWNISRYILTSVKKVELVKTQPKAITLADKWILTELNKLIESSTKDLETYKFSAVGEAVYEFTWDKLADWYVEI